MNIHSRITQLKNQFDKLEIINKPAFFNSEKDFQDAKGKASKGVNFIDDITEEDRETGA